MSSSKSDAIFAALAERYPEASRPALTHQFHQWSETRPLAGVAVLDATPLFRNTLLKHAALLAAGADLWVGYGRAIPYDKTVAEDLLPAFGLQTATETRLAEGFDVVLDCAGAFSDVPSRYGYVELTHSGAAVYKRLNVPTLLVDAGRIKTFETALGTGDGLVRGLQAVGAPPLAGKRVVVFGCGKVGRGILFGCQRAGAEVWVVDPQVGCCPPRGVTLCTGKDRAALEALLARADVVVTATGIKHALRGMFDPQRLIQSGALLANMGVEDEFGPEIPEARVLNRKAPLNFMLDDPTEMRYIDPTLALHNAAALRLLSGVAPGLHPPTAEEEATLFNLLPEALRAELEAFEAAQRPTETCYV